MLQKHDVRMCWLVSLSMMVTVLASCSDRKFETARSLSSKSLIQTAQDFRMLLDSQQYEQARVMMADDPRRWFEQRQGLGQPWKIEPGSKGPWSEWDNHFRSQKEEVRWIGGKSTATLIIRETNDYFQSLERGWVTNEIVYLFDNSGKIEGLLIRATGDRPPGRTDEFLKWAQDHNPEELEYLMPGGEIDPSGDRPERFRALLNQWRKSAELPVID